MTHLTDEDLVLHYYGEPGGKTQTAHHLRECDACARAYQALAMTLTSIAAPEVADPGREFWSAMHERVQRVAVRDQVQPRRAAWRFDPLMLVWMVPLLYPFAPRAIFESAQLARVETTAGGLLMTLSLLWAFAGPFVALMVLNRLRGDGMSRRRYRFLVYGAVAATISPALFNLTSRTGLGLPLWYAVTSLIGLASLLPIPESPISTRRLRGFHRLSALLIVLFAMAHLSNHTFAIVSVATHTTVLDLLRVVYRQPVIETLLLAAILQQIATGGALVWQAHLRRPSMRTNLQAVSGLYMAVFFLAHVSAALMARGSTDTNFVWAAGQRGLLASRGLTFLLPYYLLGVMAIFVHVGQGLRMSVLRFMPELSVQRLSYAGVAFGGAVVITLGLALCGVHVLP